MSDNYNIIVSSSPTIPLYRNPVVLTSYPPTISVSSSIASIPIGIQYPSVFSSYYPFHDLNKDKNVIRRLTKYFYYKTLDKWLWDDLKELMNYFSISDGHVVLLTNPKEEKVNESDYEKKIDFIEDHILTKNAVYKMLKDLVKTYEIEWVKLPKNEYLIRKEIKKLLTHKIKKTQEIEKK